MALFTKQTKTLDQRNISRISQIPISEKIEHLLHHPLDIFSPLIWKMMLGLRKSKENRLTYLLRHSETLRKENAPAAEIEAHQIYMRQELEYINQPNWYELGDCRF